MNSNRTIFAQIALTTLGMFLLAGAVQAEKDKPKLGGVIIKGGGTIKPSNGDEAGTLKGLVHIRLANPPKGGLPEASVPFQFELETPTKGRDGKPMVFLLQGSVRSVPGKTNEIMLRPQGRGLGLWIDGELVDYTGSRMLGALDALKITMRSTILDDASPAGPRWMTQFLRGAKDVGGPVVVLTPTSGPVPVPYPVPPQ